MNLKYCKSLILMLFMLSPFLIVGQQKTYIQPYKGMMGNTGFRGNILPDKDDKIVMNDFYIIQFRVLTSCTVVLAQMEVADKGKLFRLKPLFLDANQEMKVSAGETISVRAERDEAAVEVMVDTPEKSIFYKGKLLAKVNGKETILMVKDFENIIGK
jgi:hypothetical protein